MNREVHLMRKMGGRDKGKKRLDSFAFVLRVHFGRKEEREMTSLLSHLKIGLRFAPRHLRLNYKERLRSLQFQGSYVR